MKHTIFIDSRYGNDSFTGDIDSPLKTLAAGISSVYEGGVIVLQNGTGVSYGSATITKNLTLRAAYGATPYVAAVTFNNAQGLVEGLWFNSASGGIVINNPGIGSIIIRECRFDNVDTAINIDNCQYASVHRNYFTGHQYGVKISSAQEVCVSANIFDSGDRSIEINSVYRADVWNNTIYGSTVVTPSGVGNQNLRALYVTLTPFNISYALVQLPGYAAKGIEGFYNVAMNVVNGASFQYGVDYTVQSSGSIVSWSGRPPQQQFSVGDMIRILYAEDADPVSGDAIRIQNALDPNTRLDSNSITAKEAFPDIAIGVYFSTPIKIRHNNFYKNTLPWDGAVPTGDTGFNNIYTDPLYRDTLNSDFHLQYMGLSGSSPNIDAADPGRWDNIYAEIGVIKVDGYYTASVTGIRQNVAPFDRSIDFDLYHRGVTGMVGTTGDIGALEYNKHETAMGNYVAEQGYDVSAPGTETGPYATLDRGYARAGNLDLYVSTNVIPYQVGVTGGYTGPVQGSGYGRYHSKNIVLSDSKLNVGRTTGNDIAFVYSSYPSYETGAVYVGPDWGTGVTGSSVNPYRTITEGLAAGSRHVLVKPGFYPTFKGVTGIHLIGIEEIKAVGLGTQLYNSFLMGSLTGIGTHTYMGSREMVLTGDTDLLSDFTCDVGWSGLSSLGIDFKYEVTVGSDILYVGLINLTGSQSVYAAFDTVAEHTIVGYEYGGSTYEVPENTVPAAFTDMDVRIRITRDGKFRVTIKNSYVDREYSGALSGTYINPWRMFFISQGAGTSTVVNPYLYSYLFSGITGILNTSTRKKIFGILGSTGLQK